jgi:acyl-coenzyme A synthetase/AMP-(fatty) acid ligase
MPNRAALLIHYLACIKARLVATPLNYRYMPPEMDHALGLSGASILLAHAERADDIAASALAGKLPLGLISYGGSLGDSPSFEQLIERDAPAADLIALDPSAPAFILFTSGSTGKPKGVTHSRTTLGWMMASCAAALEITAEDVLLPGSSVSHVAGILNSLTGLAFGARVVVARSFDGHEMLALLRETRPTVLWMLPAALFQLLREHNAARDDFTSLRLCFSGGDLVPAELNREFNDLAGIAIDELYGMSETGHITINPPSGENRLGSVGNLNAGLTAAIRGEGDAELPAGQDGRLWVRGPTLTVGYWNQPEATAETIRDGWLDTGDIMRADDDGYFWFRGRRKQIIVHDGSNICPQEVEGALLTYPAVDSAGVVGVHDLMHGETVRAYITLRQGTARPSSHELIDFARARVGYKAPEAIIVLDEMPLNATGKVDRVALKKLAADQVAAEHPD